jgi:flagellar basal-body rod protein FlgG
VNRALAAGAAGMGTQQVVLDTIAANLANVDTPGFRADRPEFAALLGPDGRGSSDAGTPQRLFTQGKLEATNNDFDLALDGEGFFEVRSPSGARAFTRAGNFTPDASGRLALPNGATLVGVRLAPGSLSFSVDAHGHARTRVAGRVEHADAGQLRLCGFANNAALRLGGDGLFYATNGAGKPFRAAPGNGGFGELRQRCLERANVSIVGAMMAVLAAQRAYEANAKSVQAADEMLRLANNLERA